MSERREESGWPIIAVILALMVVSLGLYAGGYFATSEYASDTQYAVRRFTYDWQVCLFTPALKLESWVRGLKVEGVYPMPPQTDADLLSPST